MSPSLTFQALNQQWIIFTFSHIFPTRAKTSVEYITSVFYRMKEFKCPDLLAEHYKPYPCRFRQWITQHILVVLPICAMVSLPKGTL